MIVFLNGNFVPEEQAVVSVFDRGFLYGDGLFETMPVSNGKVFRWEQHVERLQRGAEFLKLKLPFTSAELSGFAVQLIAQNGMPDALLRLTLSRGVGLRGYSPRGAEQPTFVMSLHSFTLPKADQPAPRWKLITASPRLPAGESLAHFKTCNKLAQVLARAEADAVEANEALLLNTEGFVVEASSSNLFWIEGETVCTPPLASGILAGVTRAAVLEICRSLGIAATQKNITPDRLKCVAGVFLSLSSWGVVEAASLDGTEFKPSPLIESIRSRYLRLVEAETES